MNSAISIGVAPWNGNGMIEVSGVDALGAGNNGLEINTFCKRNTMINCGWDLNPTSFVNGGRVNMGAEVEMMRSLKIGWNGTPSLIDPNTAIEINQNTDNGNGVNIKTWNNSIKAFSILKSDGRTSFAVYGDGETVINTWGTDAFVIRNASNADPNTNINFKVKNTGFVYAREVNVMIGPYPDYVFKKEYKLMSINDLDCYIGEHGHLPNVPTAKHIEENGGNLGELCKIQMEKIEELTLYIIQLQKRVDQLEKK